jgi:hypothetical protein
MRRAEGAGVRTIGMRVALAAAGVVALAGCDPHTTWVSVANGCSENVQVLVSDATHHDDHVAKDFRQLTPDQSAEFIVRVGPDGDISVMTWDTATTAQVTRIVALRTDAVDGRAEDGRALRVVTLSGADCPASG